MIRVPGSYAPLCKNRSSKQYFKLTKHVPVIKSMSTEALRTMTSKEASKELERRDKNREKREIRMQRYREKLAAKRNTEQHT